MSSTRSIFEEVGADAETVRTPPPTGDGEDRRSAARRGIRLWLMILFALVTLMVAVGGLTRLTDSGLSITEWRPVTGAIPPLSAEAWEAEFAKYREIPEYQLQNKGMSLDQFKVIYWWEWGHRQLGRVIGLVWAVGFFWFLARRRIPVGWTGKLLGLGVLGGLQGAIGWWMVASGLTGERLDVASYRLATHLGLAFLILGLMFWYILQLSRPQKDLFQARRRREGGRAVLAGHVVAFVYIQILIGALVAGIDAGLSYTDWPTMGGGLLPPDMWSPDLGWRNWFENPGLVQFVHRSWGYLILLFTLFAWWNARRSGVTGVRRAFDWVAVAVFGQIVLGIGTLLYIVPWQLAILHQLGAVAVLSLALRARFLSLYPPAERISRG